MIRLWHIAPVLAGIAIASNAVWWDMKRDAWEPPTAKVPDVPDIAPMPLRAPAAVTQALQRPLLWTSRRPIPVNDKKSGIAQELLQSRLMAVLESGNERVAILRRADGSVLKITAVSDPWKLEAFDGRRAIFVSSDGQRVNRPLEPGNVTPAGVPTRRP